MNIEYIKLGQRIRFYRKQLGLSQEQLSELASLNTIHISNIETGKKAPSLKSLINIATALGVTTDQLLIDSLPQSSSKNNDLSKFLLDCTPSEADILADVLHAMKQIISKYKINK